MSIRWAAIAVMLAIAVLAFGCGSDSDAEVLRVTLGGNSTPETWESLTAEKDELKAELENTLRRLDDAGYPAASYAEAWYGIVYGDSGKKKIIKGFWPWPIQTQVARQFKEIGGIDAKLLTIDNPNPPTRTPRPAPTIDLSDSLHILSVPTLAPWPTWPPTPTPRPLPTIDLSDYLHNLSVPTSTPWPTWTPTPTPRPLPTIDLTDFTWLTPRPLPSHLRHLSATPTPRPLRPIPTPCVQRTGIFAGQPCWP